MRWPNYTLMILLSLAGCVGGGASVARYEPPASPGGRMCVFQCRHALEYCTDSCGLRERTCLQDMQAQAIKDYEAYTRAQFEARQAVDLRPSDFERPERCVDQACRNACDATYNACFVKCGGTITGGTASEAKGK